jgi:hypothetical protein
VTLPLIKDTVEWKQKENLLEPVKLSKGQTRKQKGNVKKAAS